MSRERELLRKSADYIKELTMGIGGFNSLVVEIEAELANPELEPISYMRDEGSFPVYTNPTRQQEPLSDEECMKLLKFGPSSVNLVRLVEYAHGIGGKK